jgi:exopolyphosphatase/guanosine-5'-triphosphate,3'-diphosphate pyrophosphatase
VSFVYICFSARQGAGFPALVHSNDGGGVVRYAACDVGTNSCRLLVAEVREDNKLNVLQKEIVTTRIGEGLESSGWLRPAAINRTLNCLESFVEVMRRQQASQRVVAATSAVREATNKEDFLVLAEERIGMRIEVLSGEQEGELSYLGAKKGLGLKGSPVLVDVGGGSTEVIYQRRGIKSTSIPVGAVRAWEGDWDEVEIKSRLAAELLESPGSKTSPLVLVGGTATSLVAIKRGLTVYDLAQVQGQKLTLKEITALHTRLEKLTLDERRALPGLQPERADIIGKGTLILKCLMELIERKQARVSDSDLLDGLIWSLHNQ